MSEANPDERVSRRPAWDSARKGLRTMLAALAVAPHAAAADCEPPKLARHGFAIPAIYLGDFADLLGRHASWFWDPVAETVIGPLDRDPWPGSHARVVPASTAVAGDSGIVHLTAWVEDPAHVGAVSGWFVSFAPDGQHAALTTVVETKIANWYLLGALVNQATTADDAYDRVKHAVFLTDGLKATRSLAGALSNHPTRAALAISSNYRPRDLGGMNITTLVAMLDGIAAVLASADPAPVDWTDYLPVLAASRAARSARSTT